MYCLLYYHKKYIIKVKKQLIKRYNSNYKIFSRNSDNYRILNTQQAQAVIRKVDEAMKAFFGSSTFLMTA